MKKLLSYLGLGLMMLLFCANMNAQDVMVRSSFYWNENVISPSIRATFPKEASDVQQAFQEFVSNSYDLYLKTANLGENGRYLYADNILFKELSPNKVDVLIRLQNNNDGSTMHFSVKKENDNYVNAWYNPDQFEDMRNIVLGFIHNYLPDYYDVKVSERQDNLADLSQSARYVKAEIKENQEEIVDKYQDIAKLSSEILDMRKQISELEAMMNVELDELEEEYNTYLELNQ